MLKAHDIHKSFGDKKVLKGVSMEVSKGEIVSIVGASGAGKSTFLQILGSLDSANQGSVFYDDQNILELNDKDLSAFRNLNIGFVFQFHHLLPEFTALENICIPGFISGKSESMVRERALSLMKTLNIEDLQDQKPGTLSGGEQQRVAVARALINEPSVVFADEPSGNLDSKNASELHNLFIKLRNELQQSFVIVTHNSELAELADRKLVMADGTFL